MALLTALQVQSTPNATLIILAFIAFTAALYCVPMLFRFVKRLSNPAVRLSQPADDTVYTCHDEAFLQAHAYPLFSLAKQFDEPLHDDVLDITR